MYFRAAVPIALLGLFAIATAACSGGASSPGPATLPMAGADAAQAGARTATGARLSGGARRSISGCIGSGSGSFIGANNQNVADGVDSAVVSGFNNQACDLDSGILTGQNNTINSGGLFSDEMIGAGNSNHISGEFNVFIGAGDENSITAGTDAFIGAGHANTVSGSYAAVVGGYKNKASGVYASIGGGNTNTASGTESTVAGGGGNLASGYASFAAGSHADADEGGSFVWSDSSSSASTKATVTNQFVARAAGGVEFFSNSAMTTGVSLAAGGGSWASVSDRAVKTDVTRIDDAAILDRVAAMPITQWSYISEHGVRHLGPMAQDFYAAFGVGEDDKHITSIDEDGVALAAIKALNTRVAETNARLVQKTPQCMRCSIRSRR